MALHAHDLVVDPAPPPLDRWKTRIADVRPRTLWMVGCGSGLLLAASLVLWARGFEVDFQVYRMGGQHVLGSGLYASVLTTGWHRLPFTYPPLAALALLADLGPLHLYGQADLECRRPGGADRTDRREHRGSSVTAARAGGLADRAHPRLPRRAPALSGDQRPPARADQSRPRAHDRGGPGRWCLLVRQAAAAWGPDGACRGAEVDPTHLHPLLAGDQTVARRQEHGDGLHRGDGIDVRRRTESLMVVLHQGRVRREADRQRSQHRQPNAAKRRFSGRTFPFRVH